MDCHQVNKYLPEYAAKSLQADVLHEIQEHLQQCPLCRQQAEMLLKVFNLMKKEKEIQPNPFLSTRIFERINNREIPSRNFLRPVLAGAFLGLALMAGIFAGLNAEKFTRPQQQGISNDIVLLNDMADEKIEWLLMDNK